MRTHCTDYRVRYSETDCGGVVFYANYLHYFEVGRTEYLRALGSPYRELENDGVYFRVSEARCKYLGPAGYDDELLIVTWVDRLRPTRIDFRTLIIQKQSRCPVAEGHVVLACVDAQGRPSRVPEAVVGKIELCDGPGQSLAEVA